MTEGAEKRQRPRRWGLWLVVLSVPVVVIGPILWFLYGPQQAAMGSLTYPELLARTQQMQPIDGMKRSEPHLVCPLEARLCPNQVVYGYALPGITDATAACTITYEHWLALAEPPFTVWNQSIADGDRDGFVRRCVERVDESGGLGLQSAGLHERFENSTVVLRLNAPGSGMNLDGSEFRGVVEITNGLQLAPG